eukprot:TRINITY_DN11926_c0_g1_i4.p1 TRINITY_DN11926_c0_g1~~TRINITY_DN11926_c0_g1_i4.p1  ORF type:complete len:229 (-),score=35.92 TRINITY_DN11926_c0_g1_i4:159-845(-)
MGNLIYCMEGKIVLGYWNIQGLAEPLRLLMLYLNLGYEEKLYTDTALMREDKAKLDFPFPNIPYIIHGEKTLCESEAIAYYLVFFTKREELFGKDNDERVQSAMVHGVVSDIYNDIASKIFWNKNWEADFSKTFDEKIHPRLQRLNAFAGSKKFIICDEIRLVDFALYRVLWLIKHMDTTSLDRYPNLVRIYSSFEEIPEIKAYHDTEIFKNRPVYSPRAFYQFAKNY